MSNASWLSTPISGDWNTAGNWTAGGPPNGSGQVASFGTSNTTSISFSTDTQLGGITFNAGADAYTISQTGYSSLTLSGTGITNNSGQPQAFVMMPSKVAGGLYFFDFTNNATAGTQTRFTLEGQSSSSTSYFFSFMRFHHTSTAANGNFTIKGAYYQGMGGRIQFNDTSTAGNATFTVQGGDNALNGDIEFLGSSSAANGTFNLFGGRGSTTPGGTVYFCHNSTAGNATLTAYAGGIANGRGGTIIFRDSSTAGSATLVTQQALGAQGPGEIVFQHNSTGGTATVKLFSQGRLGYSSYSGTGVTIGSLQGDAGSTAELGAKKLTVGSNNSSTVMAGVITGDGGSFDKIGTGTLTLSGANTYTGGTTISAGTLSIGSGGTTGSITGNITNNAALVFNRSNALTFSDIISGIGGLTKSGAGTLTLSGSNTYTGDTTLAGGILSIAGDGNLGIGALIFNGGSLIVTDSGIIDNVITLNSDGTIRVGNGITSSFSGVLSGGNPLTKTGAGTLLLDNPANTATMIVNEGTLGGDGKSGDLSLSSGAILAPGSGPGDLGTGNLSLASGAILEIELGGTTAGTEYDQVKVTGTINVTGAILNLTLINGFEPELGNSFTLLENDGIDAIIGTFAGLAEGALISVDGKNFKISYIGGDGNDIVLAKLTPTPSIVLASDTGLSSSDGITSNGTVNVSGLESGAIWAYSTDNGVTWNPGTGDHFTVSGDGEKNVQVQQEVVGNISFPAILSFTLDTTAPDAPTLALAEDTGASNSDGMTSNGTVNVSGLEANATWEYSTHSGRTWMAGTGSSITLSGDGAKSIVVRQTDAAGNTSPASQTLNFTLDTTAPDAPILALDNDSDGLTSNGTVNVNGLEEGASWEYSTNVGST